VVKESFELQLKLIREKIAELKQIEQCILEVSQTITEKPETDWKKMISLIHLVSMEETLAKQYQNSANIEARIELHRRFSENTERWYQWIYRNLPIHSGMKILEVGCGNGQLWKDNLDSLPKDIHIILSDVSSGMLRSAKNNVQGSEAVFSFNCFDFNEIPHEDESFDLVIANHSLFYAKDREKTLKEIHRVLKKGGLLCCSTYGKQHMKEIELLAKEFDDRIALSEVKLYDIFGLDNGTAELAHIFNNVQIYRYEDSLRITESQPLLDYIYSCHGNQMEYIGKQQDRFEKFILNKIGTKGLRITKDAGIFLCVK
jgi:ubiquinone/menaquinone biosynthesis C-methylase UbiE